MPLVVLVTVAVQIAHRIALHNARHTRKHHIALFPAALQIPAAVALGVTLDLYHTCHDQEPVQRNDKDGSHLHPAHPGIHHPGGHDADDAPIQNAQRLIDQVIFLPVQRVQHAALAALRQGLHHGVKVRLIHLGVLAQIVKKVSHLLGDLGLCLGGKHHFTVGAHDIAIALSLIDHAAQQLFQHGVVVADRQRRIGGPVQLQGLLHRDGKHDLADALTGDITGDHRLVCGVQFLKSRLHVLCCALPPGGGPELTLLVEQVKISVLPCSLLGDILLPLSLLLSPLRKGAQIAVPVGQDVPVALRKHGKGLGRLPIGGKQICRAFLIDLLLRIISVNKDADQQCQQHPRYEQDIFSFFLHKAVFPLTAPQPDLFTIRSSKGFMPKRRAQLFAKSAQPLRVNSRINRHYP